jgi:pimeloyl-ACP methyl ester carboxylesterase
MAAEIPMSARVQERRRRGERVQSLGRSIHVFRREGQDPLLLLLHGFPSSSFDWRTLLASERR